MEVERKRSKGSFFNFFDWNGKSRKKLFAKDPELPERTNEGKENNVESVAMFESRVAEIDERRANSSTRGSSDFSCTSSVTSDDGFGTRAPGVVARLMGLNSLPTSHLAHPSSTPFFGSFRETQYDRTSTPNLYSEYNPIEYNPISRSQKGPNRPIERFQTETLPPKSAKSIPIPHHKLLSPIRSPGFVSRKNTAYIVEAAAKIIEASPKGNMSGRVPSISSPSVPLRIRELKQKMEAANTAYRPQRSNEPIVAKDRKGISRKASVLAEKGKGKSVSYAGPRNINSTKQKEKPNQTGTQKTKGASETTRTSKILKQNNLKQNCQSSSKESLASKSSAPIQRGRKAQSFVQARTVQKAVSKPEPMSKKRPTLKKRPVNGENRTGRSVSIKCNIEVDGFVKSDFDERKGGMDVVSFTFTSPVKSKSSNIDTFGSKIEDTKKSTSFHGLNIIGADALSALLEEKLRELTNKVESSECNIIRDEISSQKSQFPTQKGNLDCLDSFDCLSTEDSSLTENSKWQGSIDVEECSSSSNFSQAEKDHYRHPSPVSILEPSFESGSCSNTNVQADEALSIFSTNNYIESNNDTELSDSATSICTFSTKRKHSTETSITSASTDLPNWELHYVQAILDNADTMLKDFQLGKTSKPLSPQLFHQIENQHYGTKQNEQDHSKHERKVLFDCVSECLDSISTQTFMGTPNSSAKLHMVFKRKEWSAKELWKDILSWKNMGDSMVDELVDKDMSSRDGKWVDFDVEIFEQGVEIERKILTCLVDELVYDVFML